ncbi:MAG: NAD(P)(+) transhydrogenase (Re/Si-specific) subunit beta, partial [Flavitalea sp.]
MELSILTIIYIIASLTFIIGLKMLSNPASARKGNLIAAGGMTLAIIGTIFLYEDEGRSLGNYGWIFSGLFIGGVIGTVAARKVKMTAMPEMVSLFNGMGGACAALISVVEFNHLLSQASIDEGAVYSPTREAVEFMFSGGISTTQLLIILAGLVIGGISFAGSMIAWGKLNGKIKDFAFKGQHIANLVVFGVIVLGSLYLLINVNDAYEPAPVFLNHLKLQVASWPYTLFYTIVVLSLIYGVLFVLPIGGADMPVVISLLNSFTGVAAACGGFLYDNKVMLTGGILVGAAGTLLTILMCKAMNRSLLNVLVGSFGGGNAAGGAGVKKDQGNYKEITLSDAAVVMSYAHKVIIVPGYGLAVAQAQHACH